VKHLRKFNEGKDWVEKEIQKILDKNDTDKRN
jgi:hypothetical protein